MRVLLHMNLLFKPFANRQVTVPISFNYTYLFKGIRIILDSEFCLAITSALTLLYLGRALRMGSRWWQIDFAWC